MVRSNLTIVVTCCMPRVCLLENQWNLTSPAVS